jgi:hypothetical protein
MRTSLSTEGRWATRVYEIFWLERRLAAPWHGCVDNTKVDLTEIGRQYVVSIKVAQNGIRSTESVLRS